MHPAPTSSKEPADWSAKFREEKKRRKEEKETADRRDQDKRGGRKEKKEKKHPFAAHSAMNGRSHRRGSLASAMPGVHRNCEDVMRFFRCSNISKIVEEVLRFSKIF